eukprot:jgi/Tetstr1/449055/TSEL_036270.t1
MVPGGLVDSGRRRLLGGALAIGGHCACGCPSASAGLADGLAAGMAAESTRRLRADSACGEALSRCFPGSLSAGEALRRTTTALGALDSNLGPASVLYGHSICPDEINNAQDGLPSRMAGHWGEVFPLGGLGGAPFAGKTGFSAFSHHVPYNGSIIILFGPHIAISASGELGKYRRQGQAADSAACGAVLAAYNSCCQADAAECNTTAPLDMLDLEQAWLRQRVAPRCRGVAAAQEPLQELIHGVYQDIEENMLALVNHDFGPGRLILLGGIQINLPAPYEDHFQPLLFRASSQAEPNGTNLLQQLVGRS